MQTSEPKDGTDQSEEGTDSFGSEIADEMLVMQSSVTPQTKSDARRSDALLRQSLQIEELRMSNKRLGHQVKAIRDNRKMRKNYARRALNLAELAFVFWIIVFGVAAVGNLATGSPPFSDKALMTFTAGATVNVFVAFVGIIKGLFPATKE